MSGIPLRIAEPAGRSRRSLRRYRSRLSADGACPAGGYCNASTPIGDVGASEAEAHGDNWPHDDPRWPHACARCGCAFTPDDEWQRNDDAIYRLPDGTEFALSRSLGMVAPPGTMIRAAWYDEHAGQRGESWLIALPDGGDWITTQTAKGGGFWTVTGTPPDITATPSVWHNAPNGWHGWVRGGRLEDA
jgi:hypothetical protein